MAADCKVDSEEAVTVAEGAILEPIVENTVVVVGVVVLVGVVVVLVVSAVVVVVVGAVVVVGVVVLVGVGGVVEVAVVAGVVGETEPDCQIWNSARPTAEVDALMPVTEKRRPVTDRGVKVTFVAVPLLLSVPTLTVEPSEKVMSPAVMLSDRFGRSNSTTRSTFRGALQRKSSQLPVRPPSVAHSRVRSAG